MSAVSLTPEEKRASFLRKHLDRVPKLLNVPADQNGNNPYHNGRRKVPIAPDGQEFVIVPIEEIIILPTVVEAKETARRKEPVKVIVKWGKSKAQIRIGWRRHLRRLVRAGKAPSFGPSDKIKARGE